MENSRKGGVTARGGTEFADADRPGDWLTGPAPGSESGMPVISPVPGAK